MNKNEIFNLVNEILLFNKKQILKEYNYDLAYDIKTNCKDYIINKNTNDYSPAYCVNKSVSSSEIKMDINYIYNYIKNNKNIGLQEYINNDDIKLLVIIYHELTHVYQNSIFQKINQNKKIKTNAYNETIYYIYKLVMEELFYYQNIYIEYHNYYPNEHHANVNGLYQAIDTLDTNELVAMKEYLTFGYDKLINNIMPPFDYLLSMFNYKDKKIKFYIERIKELTSKLNLYEKLCFGLKVDKYYLDEIKRYRGNSKSLIKELKK